VGLAVSAAEMNKKTAEFNHSERTHPENAMIGAMATGRIRASPRAVSSSAVVEDSLTR
jgi:hypothetical protein